MRLLLFFLFGLIQIGFSQNRLAFRSLRYDEAYSASKIDSNANFMDRIKFIPIGRDSSFALSVGGEIRLQYQYFKDENWGDTTNDRDGFLLNRALFHLDAKLGKHLRLFSQLQSSTEISRVNPNPLERNELDLHQLFADFHFGRESNKIIFRIGRQELLYGSQRLVAVREGPNSRQSFDAAKIIWKSKIGQTDAFYGQFVRNVFGSFNDRMNPDMKFFGLYNVAKNVPIVQNLDLYYLGLNKDAATFNAVSGEENRHSVGTRVWCNDRDWKYDVEAVYQFGTIAGQTISAWTVSLHTSYTFSAMRFKPEIGFKTEVISGDRSTGDNKLQTFNPLFPRGSYFGLAALLGPSNLYDLHPSLEMQINDKLSAGVDYDLFWRFSKQDGIYQPNTELIYTSGDSPNRFIGAQLGASADYSIRKWLTVTIEATWFDSGAYLKDASAGKDIFFTAATLTYRF